MKTKKEIKELIRELDDLASGDIAPVSHLKIQILTLLEVIDFDMEKPKCISQDVWNYNTKKEKEGATWE